MSARSAAGHAATPAVAGAGGVDVDAVRAVHRRFPTGVTVVTTASDGRPWGLVVNAFASVSLEPPLVLVCIARSAATHDRLLRGEHLAINILAHDQAGVAACFARSGGDKFRDVAWHRGPCGSPLLDGAAASLEVVVQQRLLTASHTIFVGLVLDAQAGQEAPLLYLGGRLYDGADLRPAADDR